MTVSRGWQEAGEETRAGTTQGEVIPWALPSPPIAKEHHHISDITITKNLALDANGAVRPALPPAVVPRAPSNFGRSARATMEWCLQPSSGPFFLRELLSVRGKGAAQKHRDPRGGWVMCRAWPSCPRAAGLLLPTVPYQQRTRIYRFVGDRSPQTAPQAWLSYRRHSLDHKVADEELQASFHCPGPAATGARPHPSACGGLGAHR